MKYTLKLPSYLLALASAWTFYANSIPAAHAMGVTPTVIEMTAAGGKSRATITVNNPGQKPLPVEINVSRLELDENGKQSATSAKADFAIFPPTALVPAGQAQVFRIQWTADPQLSQSRTYIFTVGQVPVKTSDPQTGVNIVLKFAVVVNVAPLDATPKLSVKKTAIIALGDKRHLAVLIQNDGNRHALLSDLSIVLTSRNWGLTLDSAQLQRLIGLGLVQPKKSRQIVVPVDIPATVTEVNARLEYVTR